MIPRVNDLAYLSLRIYNAMHLTGSSFVRCEEDELFQQVSSAYGETVWSGHVAEYQGRLATVEQRLQKLPRKHAAY